MKRRYIVTLPVEIDVDDDTPARSTEYRLLTERIGQLMQKADSWRKQDEFRMSWIPDPEDPEEDTE